MKSEKDRMRGEEERRRDGTGRKGKEGEERRERGIRQTLSI